jgi:hypothetical protein
MADDEAATLIERFIVEEHFLRVEYVAARLPERRTWRRGHASAGAHGLGRR